jgi:hypothetical protein
MDLTDSLLMIAEHPPCSHEFIACSLADLDFEAAAQPEAVSE